MAADRTTIKTAVQTLLTRLRANLAANPPTASKPFRRVEEGPAGAADLERPFLTLQIVETEPVASIAGDKIVRVTLLLRVTADVISNDPHQEILSAIGSVEDYFDSLLQDEEDIVEGADGFDDRRWTFEYPAGSAGPQAARAACRQTFIVKIEREEN